MGSHPTPTRVAPGFYEAPSSSGGDGHFVEVKTAKDGGVGRYVTCSCVAGRNAHGTKPGCWAMKAVRQVEGIAEPASLAEQYAASKS